MNTVFDITLNNGQQVKMTLNFKALYLLRSKNKKAYDDYMRCTNTGPKDEMEFAQMLYAAYLCANLEDYDNTMEFLDFLEKLPVNRKEISDIYGKVLQPRKNADSRKPSERR